MTKLGDKQFHWLDGRKIVLWFCSSLPLEGSKYFGVRHNREKLHHFSKWFSILDLFLFVSVAQSDTMYCFFLELWRWRGEKGVSLLDVSWSQRLNAGKEKHCCWGYGGNLMDRGRKRRDFTWWGSGVWGDGRRGKEGGKCLVYLKSSGNEERPERRKKRGG